MKIQFNRFLEVEEVPRIIEIILENGEVRTFARNEYFLREGQKATL